MHPLVKHFYTLPAYSTVSQKGLCNMLPTLDFKGNINVIDDDTIIQVPQNNTTAYQLEYYGDKVVKYWKIIKANDRKR